MTSLEAIVQLHSRRPRHKRYVDPLEIKSSFVDASDFQDRTGSISPLKYGPYERSSVNRGWKRLFARLQPETPRLWLLCGNGKVHVLLTRLMQAKRVVKAVSDVQVFYQRKYSSSHDRPGLLAQAMLHAHAQNTTEIQPVRLQELQEVVAECPAKKSTGADGISSEALRAILQSELGDELVDLFNEVLLGERDFPQSWLCNNVVFLPKVHTPTLPKHLRSIVLSLCVAKLFTEALLQRMRPQFPPLRCGQLCARNGGQVLDGALAAQQLTYISAEYSLPLLLLKLNFFGCVWLTRTPSGGTLPLCL